MSDFEVVQPEPQQPPALQLALDRLAQRRAYEQSAQQERQLWEDSQPPTLTYLGQSNGQPLLQAAGGQPFSVGSRDSNGSLLPGLADVAIGSGVVRVGGMPRVRTVQQSSAVQTMSIVVLMERKDMATETTEVFVKENANLLASLGQFEKPVNGAELTAILGTQSFAYLDQNTLLAQFALRYSLSPSTESNTVLVAKNRGVVLRVESSIVNSDSGELLVYPASLSSYTPSLLPAPNVAPLLYAPYSFEETAASGAVLPDGTAVFVFQQGNAQASANAGTNFKDLLNGVSFGCARGKPTGNEIPTQVFTARQAVQLSQADLVVWGLNQESLIRLSQGGVAQTIEQFRLTGFPSSIFYDEDGYEYRLKFVRGYTNTRI